MHTRGDRRRARKLSVDAPRIRPTQTSRSRQAKRRRPRARRACRRARCAFCSAGIAGDQPSGRRTVLHQVGEPQSSGGFARDSVRQVDRSVRRHRHGKRTGDRLAAARVSSRPTTSPVGESATSPCFDTQASSRPSAVQASPPTGAAKLREQAALLEIRAGAAQDARRRRRRRARRPAQAQDRPGARSRPPSRRA